VLDQETEPLVPAASTLPCSHLLQGVTTGFRLAVLVAASLAASPVPHANGARRAP
jgi:hypothetical protein